MVLDSKAGPGMVVGWTPNSLSLLIRTIALHTVKAVTGVAGAVGACWSLVSWLGSAHTGKRFSGLVSLSDLLMIPTGTAKLLYGPSQPHLSCLEREVRETGQCVGATYHLIFHTPNTKSTGMIGRVTNSLSTLTTGDYSITLPSQYSCKTPKAGV